MKSLSVRLGTYHLCQSEIEALKKHTGLRTASELRGWVQTAYDNLSVDLDMIRSRVAESEDDNARMSQNENG